MKNSLKICEILFKAKHFTFLSFLLCSTMALNNFEEKSADKVQKGQVWKNKFYLVLSSFRRAVIKLSGGHCII